MLIYITTNTHTDIPSLLMKNISKEEVENMPKFLQQIAEVLLRASSVLFLLDLGKYSVP